MRFALLVPLLCVSVLTAQVSSFDVYLIGNLEITLEDQPIVLEEIANQLDERTSPAAVVLLGNTISNQGLPEEGTTRYDDLVNHFQELLRPVVEKADHFFVIPGQNEWHNGHRRATLDNLDEADDFFERVFESDKIFRPQNGCGEPLDFPLGEHVQLVLFDSQWLLNGDDGEQRKRASCDVDDELDFAVALDDMLKDNRTKHVILASHHPIWTAGQSGGFYPLKDHLFPLTNVIPGLYIPLPVVGSLVPLTRKLLGGPQDLSHPNYASYRAAIESALTNFENTLVVGAHDHNLQYFKKSGSHYIVSGSSNHSAFLAKSQPVFGSRSIGYSRLSLLPDQQMQLSFIEVDTVESSSTLIWQEEIADRPTAEIPVRKTVADQEYPSTYKAVGTDIYGMSPSGRRWFGSNYRDEWGAQVEAQTLLLDTAFGGLSPIKKGGGFQTKSLRLETVDGSQYTMRSVGKYSEKLVPKALRNTFVQGVVQDGISASHPYGALAIPKLADAALVYHTNPRLVYAPEQEGLGIYNEEFANQLYIFEERPQGDASKISSFGNSDKILSTLDVIEKIEKDEDHVVDQNQVLRSRLFDIWLADWDRHEDQWRWASFEQDGKIIYRPIPRDRDQVFFKLNGIISWFIKRPYFKPNFQEFSSEIKSISGLNYNGRHFDRSFLNQKTKEEFLQVAADLQTRLTDDIIDEAIKDLPQSVYSIGGPEIAEILKQRRANLLNFAERYYALINNEVTITGTNRNEFFQVDLLPSGHTKVEVFDLNKEGEKKRSIYNRDIESDLTKEILIFGLKGDDQFEITGNSSSHPKIRIVGGPGDDQVTALQSGATKILLYDKVDGVEVLQGKNKIKSLLSSDRGINLYDRKEWKQNKLLHFPLLTFFTDEGLGIGYNALWTRHGFRKEPFKSNHRISASYSPRRSSLHFEYQGLFTDVIKKTDFQLSASFDGPQFIQYFYGLGNSRPSEGEDRFFHIVTGHSGLIIPEFKFNWTRERSLGVGPIFEYFDIDPDPDRFPLQPESGLGAEDLASETYAGAQINYHVQRLNQQGSPSRGMDFKVSWTSKWGLMNTELKSHNLQAELKTYVPFNVNHTVVWASNVGYAHNFGDFAFYHANYLANRQRLRGFELGKFGGEEMFYHANDLRITLSSLEQSVQKFSWGMHGSFDYGRVWHESTEDLDEDTGFHSSLGGGLFLSPLDVVIFRISYFRAKDDFQWNIGVNFSF